MGWAGTMCSWQGSSADKSTHQTTREEFFATVHQLLILTNLKPSIEQSHDCGGSVQS